MNARSARIRCSVLCFWGTLLLFFINNEGAQIQQVRQEEQTAEEYARQLWTADNSVRIWAKSHLIQLGPKAAKPLIALLQDQKNYHPLFLPGKEKEGAQILEELRKAPSPQRAEKALNRLADIEITGRLIRDACEILGAIHSAEAVPILVDMAGREALQEYIDRGSPSLSALIQIGSPAVPYLIPSIKNTEDWISSRSGSIELSRRVQLRMVFALGEIGDARALPILEDLLPKDPDKFFIRTITEAIRKIKEKKQIK